MKQTGGQRQRRRSNPAVALLPCDVTHAAPNHVPVVCPQVITLSSDASTATAETADAITERARKGKSALPVVHELDDMSDEEFVAEEKAARPKRSYKATRKFHETWAAQLTWAELFRGSDGLFESVKCVVCLQVTGKPKILGPKWDTLSKHSGKRKATKNLPEGIKKGQWYIAKNCKHLRFERIYAARNTVTVAQQLAVVKGERARKRIQFATILHLLQEGRPMLEYTALQPLLTFMEVPKLPRRHSSDNLGWELADCLFQQAQLKIKEVMKSARFFSVTCDEVTTLDTQSWISIHGYVCEGWERKPMLLSLERVLDGGGSNNLTQVIVEAIKNQGGITEADLQTRFASFGAGLFSSFSMPYIFAKLHGHACCRYSCTHIPLCIYLTRFCSSLNLGCFVVHQGTNSWVYNVHVICRWCFDISGEEKWGRQSTTDELGAETDRNSLYGKSSLTRYFVTCF